MRFLMVVLAGGARAAAGAVVAHRRRAARGVATRDRGRPARPRTTRRLAARNAALEAEVQDLKQGLAAAEERARTELGMIEAGETFYQIAPAALAQRQRCA